MRLAQSEDVARVVALIDNAYAHYVPRLGRNPQPMTDDYEAMIASSQVWVLDGDVALDGILVVQTDEDYLLVRTIAVAPSRQRQGLGTQLLHEAEHLAVSADRSTLRLYTNEVMTGNVELYERLGYIETHRSGPKGKQVVYMMKELK